MLSNQTQTQPIQNDDQKSDNNSPYAVKIQEDTIKNKSSQKLDPDESQISNDEELFSGNSCMNQEGSVKSDKSNLKTEGSNKQSPYHKSKTNENNEKVIPEPI